MELNAVTAQRLAQNLSAVSGQAIGASGEAAPFADVLQNAMQHLEGLQANADGAMALLASGQPVELHEVMLATEQASLGFRLALQVRTKIIEAYQEIMRTQV